MAAHASGGEASAGRGGAAIERFVYWFGALLSLAHVYFNVIATLPQLWLAAIHFAGFGLIGAGGAVCVGTGAAVCGLFVIVGPDPCSRSPE